MRREEGAGRHQATSVRVRERTTGSSTPPFSEYGPQALRGAAEVLRPIGFLEEVRASAGRVASGEQHGHANEGGERNVGFDLLHFFINCSPSRVLPS